MIPISSRARKAGRLHVFDLDVETHVRHCVAIPGGMCPISRNPIRGTLDVQYTALVALEVVSLHALVEQAQDNGPKTFEAWAAHVARTIAAAVEAPVSYTATAIVHPGEQMLEVSACVSI